jgi:hypothetical protein
MLLVEGIIFLIRSEDSNGGERSRRDAEFAADLTAVQNKIADRLAAI